MDTSGFLYRKDDLIVCEPCIAFTLFADVRLSAAAPPDLLGPYRVFMEDFRAEVNWCRTDGNQMHATRVTDKELAVLPNWLADPKRRARQTAVGEFRAGRERDEWRAPCLELHYAGAKFGRFFVQISLSLDWLKEEGRRGVEQYLHRMLAGGFPLLSGYVGLGFVWAHPSPVVHDELEPVFLQHLRRHPGLMSTRPGSQSLVARYSLVDIGWITLLGGEFCARMGGVDVLRSRCASVNGAVVEALPGEGVMIRLGEEPRLGDTEEGDSLEDYRTLGRLLSPLRDASRLERKLVVAGFNVHSTDDEPRKKWIHRFF